jgi:hypothetical protein
MATAKPYFKLTIGAKPYTSADMRFGCGRIRLEVSDAHPDAAKTIADLCDTRWDAMCRKVLAYFEAAPPVSIPDMQRGLGVHLTEPGDWTLRSEIERLDRAAAMKAAICTALAAT